MTEITETTETTEKEERVLSLIEFQDKIIPGDVSVEYTEKYEYINLSKMKNIFESLEEKGFIRWFSRGTYKSTNRFSCICHMCKKKFKSNMKNSNVCYYCSRLTEVPLEREHLLSHMEAGELPSERRWGNLHEYKE